MREIKYEDDFAKFIKKIKSTKGKYKKFLQCYSEFKKTFEIDAENEITPEIIKYEPSPKSIRIMNSNNNPVKNLFDSLEKLIEEVDYNKISEIACKLPGTNVFFNVRINSLDDTLKYINKLLRSKNMIVFNNFMYALKIVAVSYSEILIKARKHDEILTNNLIRFNELFINRKEIPNDLVETIQKNLIYDYYSVDEDKEEYINNFISYVNNHNNSCKNNKVKTFNPSDDENKNEIIKPKPNDENICETIIYKDDKKEESSLLIKNYAKSYLSLIKSCTADEFDSYLPDSRIPNYLEILKELKKYYEKYLNELAKKGQCTMEDAHKYFSLNEIINDAIELKEK